MTCPKCGGLASEFSITHLVVQITIYKCNPCSKLFRTYKLTDEYSKEDLHDAWADLRGKDFEAPDDTRAKAIKFLERKIEGMVCHHLTIKKPLRARISDFQDRVFLKNALGEDYSP